MRRVALALVVLVGAFGVAAAGCGGEEEASPTPDTVIGTTDTTETDTTETETTETETTETETTETETETETTETGGQGDAAAGKPVFITNCGTCHTLADAGTTGSVGPDLDASSPSFDLAVDRVTNGQGVMPPFKDSLSAQQITDVATYVSQAAGG